MADEIIDGNLIVQNGDISIENASGDDSHVELKENGTTRASMWWVSAGQDFNIRSFDASGNPVCKLGLKQDGNIKTFITNPTLEEHLVNKGWVDTNFFAKTGGAITGDFEIKNDSNKHIWFSNASGEHDGLLYYDTSVRNIILRAYSSDNSSYGSLFLASSGNASVSALVPDADAHLTRKDYVDGRIVKMTQSEYDAITPDESVLYCIVG